MSAPRPPVAAPPPAPEPPAPVAPRPPPPFVEPGPFEPPPRALDADAVEIDPEIGLFGITPGRSSADDVLSRLGHDCRVSRYDNGQIFSISYDFDDLAEHRPARPENRRRPASIELDGETVSKLKIGAYQTGLFVAGGINTQCSTVDDVRASLGEPPRAWRGDRLEVWRFGTKGIELLIDEQKRVVAITVFRPELER